MCHDAPITSLLFGEHYRNRICKEWCSTTLDLVQNQDPMKYVCSEVGSKFENFRFVPTLDCCSNFDNKGRAKKVVSHLASKN